MLRARLVTGFCLVLVAIHVASFSRSASSTALIRRVTTTGEEILNLNPSLSGDGRIVTFESTANLGGASGGNGFRAIRVDLSANPAAFTQLGVSRAVAPAISQDGSRIAFASNEDLVGSNSDRNSEIFLFDGSGVLQITNTTPADTSARIRDGNFQPSIADDGSVVAFSSNRNLTGQNADYNFEVLTIDTTTGVITQITSSVEIAGATEAKISGDGSHVAFVRVGSEGQSDSRDLLLYDRITGRTAPVATNCTGLYMTYGRAISDNGSRMVYSAETGPLQSQVFLFDSRSNFTTQIAALSARADDVPLHPTISGDGKRIAFATRRNVIGGNNDRSVELYVYDTPTRQITKLTDAPVAATAAVVSSLNDDGSKAAFSFPRVLSGSVSLNDLADNSEIYVTTIEPRPAFGTFIVFNGAAHGSEPGPDQTIAPDSIAIAKGSALASETRQGELSVDGSFPLSLAGTTATVNGRAARILFVSPAQVTFVVPAETELGGAEVLIKNSEGFQSRANVTIIPSAPGLFSVSGDGRGEGIILNADTLQAGPFDPTSGQLRLLLFATGARGISELFASIHGRSLSVEATQRSAGLPGLDELHILIPPDLRGAGIVTLTLSTGGRESNGVELTLTGSFVRDILINEFLADPADGLAGDANRDGVRNSSHDEFVELVNTTERDFDLSAYQLQTRGLSAITDIVRHRFAVRTILPAGTAVVVFGGGNFNQSDNAFGGAQIYKASTGGLSLLNSGGVITLRDPAGTLITSLTYGGSTGLHGDANESLTRWPDVTGSFRLHQTASGSSGRLFSPGTRVDGSIFRSPSPSPTPIPSPSPSPTPSPNPMPFPSPLPSPTPVPLVVISEFRTRGPGGASDEFVELYNNSDLPMAIAGWKIRGSSNSGSISTRLAIAMGTIVPARGHFLATNSGYSGTVAGDQTYTSGIANDGGLALTLPDDSVVDQVGLSAGSAFKEGIHIAPLPGDANQSHERRPGGFSGSTQDTNDNFTDFQLLTPSDPQNLNANPTPGPPMPGQNPSPSPSTIPSPSMSFGIFHLVIFLNLISCFVLLRGSFACPREGNDPRNHTN
ncbi:hypothetical protein BH18ACI4_BH18ACI4_26020 [soil metagenome]